MKTLDFRWLQGGKVIETSENIALAKHNLFIPAGFRSDGASIPRCLHWYARPFGEALYAAVVHDFCYRTHAKPKVLADSIFYELLLESGMNKYKAWSMYMAVKLFGHRAYKKGVNKR